jgi:ubiquinone/menaquinone biosynthesis C-methylase UbiE
MNRSHSSVTDWGLTQVSVEPHDVILDVGCGGGRTVGKLASKATEGKVYGVDYSEESVAASTRRNAHEIAAGRVEIALGSVSQLPFPDGMFDLVTAVETHIWWPDLPSDLREVRRVLKPSGQLAIISEVYKGAHARTSRVAELYARRTGMTLLTPDEHRRLLGDAGYSDVQIAVEETKGWICATARL